MSDSFAANLGQGAGGSGAATDVDDRRPRLRRTHARQSEQASSAQMPSSDLHDSAVEWFHPAALAVSPAM